jgi:GDP-L-fucose synthase
LSIKALARVISEVIGFDGDFLFDESKPDGVPRKLLDIGKIGALGWSPKIGLKEGLRRTYQWYMSEVPQ